MIKPVVLALVLGLHAPPVAAIDVPSGQPVELWQVLVDQVGPQIWLRFRFLTPQIAQDTGSITYEDASGDFEVLCEDVALPYMAEHALTGDIVMITLLDRMVEFGQPDPDATQFIDAFRPEGDTCVQEEL
jgi:hypothetical protein